MSKNGCKIWVAVRIERGFPVEAKGYECIELAEQQEGLWREEINLDMMRLEYLNWTLAISSA